MKLHVEINHKRIAGVTRVTLKKSIKTLADTCAIEFPVTADNPLVKNFLHPYHYLPLKIWYGNTLFFTGNIVKVTPQNNIDSTSIIIEAASPSNILQNSTFSGIAYPLEWNKIKIQDLIKYIAQSFSLTFSTNIEDAYLFNKLECRVDQTIFNFLKPLLASRGMRLVNSNKGELTLVNIGQATVLGSFSENDTVGISTVYNTSQMYQTYTGMIEEGFNINTKNITIKNPYMNIKRPSHITYIFNDLDDGTTLQQALEMKIRKNFLKNFTCGVKLSSWKINEKIIDINQYVYIMAPSQFIYQSTKFIIESVTYTMEANAEQCTLQVTLPQVYDATLPFTSLPWGNQIGNYT